MAKLFELIWHSFLDTLTLVPFLFLTYLLMEYLEHKTGGAAEKVLKRSGQFGPVIGSTLGLLTQCGFSSAAAGLYSARVISLGTLISVFLATSDEMIAIFISRGTDLFLLLKVLLVKFAIALIAGFAINLVVHLIHKRKGITEDTKIHELCERENCKCHHDILRSTLIHTGKICGFIFLFTFALNFLVYFVGESNIALLVVNKPILANILAAIVGIIPNCASSVIISELFVEGVISAGALLSGLLVNSGVALAVLFRNNRPKKDTWIIVAILFAISVLVGIVVDLTPISHWLAI